MTAVDPAALRELAQGLTVPTIAEAGVGTRVEVDPDLTWVAVDDIWYPLNADEEAGGGELKDWNARITHVPLPVDQLAAVRAALEGAAAGLERSRAVEAQRDQLLAALEWAKGAANEGDLAEARAALNTTLDTGGDSPARVKVVSPLWLLGDLKRGAEQVRQHESERGRRRG